MSADVTDEELKGRLNVIANSLGPVAAALMQRACGDAQEHTEKCTCYTCRAFLATHAAMNDLEAIIRELEITRRRRDVCI